MYMRIKYHQFFRLAASLLKQKGNLWFKQKFNDKLYPCNETNGYPKWFHDYFRYSLSNVSNKS